ncbi:MAG: nucleoside 2-deoxyribosyltransferase [Chloroflexi bacterium]|nr:nucleoside 2-deoxyribosyltransferase [Chloroflexota bacterium]
MRPTVYLAGPITDQTESQANDWRREVAAQLKAEGIHGVSPLRCEPLHEERYTTTYPDQRFGTPRAIGSKNLFDVRMCDMTLAYMPRQSEPDDNAQAAYEIEHPDTNIRFKRDLLPSLGTICEIAWAKAYERPAVLVTNDPRIKSHPVIDSCAGWLVETMEEGLDIVIGVLGGDTVNGKHV